jgi:hypothetical protein
LPCRYVELMGSVILGGLELPRLLDRCPNVPAAPVIFMPNGPGRLPR